jgi:WD40 repeat protein
MSAFDRRPASESSDSRAFAEVLKTRKKYSEKATLLTTKKVYVGDYAKIIVYDTTTGRIITEIASGGGIITNISQSKDEKRLFISCCVQDSMIIDMDTWKTVILRGDHDVIYIVESEGIDVLTCSMDKTIRRWNSLTGECLKIYEGHTGYFRSILYDEATKRIFAPSHDTTIIVWNGETGEKIRVMEGHRDWVGSLVRVNSTTIASGSGDGTIKLWNMTTLTCIKTIANERAVWSLAATPDGQYLISGSDDNKVRVRSVTTGQCMHTLAHHQDCVAKVAISPDGRFIASNGYDNSFHLLGVTPPFPFLIYKGILARNGREESLSLFSDGVIRASDGDLVTPITSTSTCSLVSDNRIVIHSRDSVELTAPSISSAHLWSEAISVVAADLALHPDDRARSVDQMIRRYRFNLLQRILFHVREADFRRHIPRGIVQIVGSYLFRCH